MCAQTANAHRACWPHASQRGDAARLWCAPVGHP